MCLLLFHRWTATQALKSDYFSSYPPPTPGPKLPLPRSKKDVERDVEVQISAARKRGLDDDSAPTGKIAKRLQF